MISLCLRYLVAFVLAVGCLPGIAQAQTTASSFEQLRRLLNSDDVIVVVEHSGRETLGRVVEVTPLSIVVSSLRSESGPSGMVRWISGERQTFPAADIAVIHRTNLSSGGRILLYTTPGPFQPLLQGRLKIGQTAIVVDSSGREIAGKVAELSSSSLVLRNGSVGQSFDASEVAIIKRKGPIWDGAIKGAGIGIVSMALAFSAYACYTGCEGAYPMAAGIGAAIGLGIDAAFGPKTVYRSAPQKRTVSLAPILRKDRQGVAASIRF